MQCEQKNHLWLGRFAVRLMELRQDITLSAAVGRAVRAHGWAAELRPEAAAEIDAGRLASAAAPEPGVARRRAGGAATQPR